MSQNLKFALATPEAWENEGGSLRSPSGAETLGVRRVLTETFTVGGYNYTNLADAVAQAHRMAKLERELL